MLCSTLPCSLVCSLVLARAAQELRVAQASAVRRRDPGLSGYPGQYPGRLPRPWPRPPSRAQGEEPSRAPRRLEAPLHIGDVRSWSLRRVVEPIPAHLRTNDIDTVIGNEFPSLKRSELKKVSTRANQQKRAKPLINWSRTLSRGHWCALLARHDALLLPRTITALTARIMRFARQRSRKCRNLTTRRRRRRRRLARLRR